MHASADEAGVVEVGTTPDAAEATDRFVDEPGGVGAGAVDGDLVPGVEDTDRDGVPGVVEADEAW